MTMRSGFGTSVLLSLAIVIGGCTSQGSARNSGLCPQGLTYSCAAKVGKIQSCACATREDLKQILDPVNDY